MPVLPVPDLLRARLHGRYFQTSGNPQGLSSSATLFHYRVDEHGIHGTYQGGRVLSGQLIGRALDAERIELLYHCLTTEGELLSGWSHGIVGVDARGRTTLTFTWGWLAGADGGGESHYLETRP